eukprot:Plantae.Rhodophyta-Palmaria_palmata.ctg9778.p1 GENE.Plantae.Rhodophyta-Palmaria_palmata.ctg9778~~Plantae.Rhodophyta-Palmaria_palmata.ctg9778.p1  ORF type:complete len:202 (+),score=18.60 Plantae.Rhodophyta-Palmaria_palmata.ctg9778:228-833(+)
MIAVHKDFRGQDLLPLLYHWVLCFVRENWTMECMNNDVEHGNIMFKATQQSNAVIESNKGEHITDKQFLYTYCGFGVRIQKGSMAMLMGGRRPADEEAVCYIKLPKMEYLHAEHAFDPKTAWKENIGKRMCDNCNRTERKVLVCSRCRHSFYCTKQCQRNDWKRHKMICGKKKEEVEAMLLEMGLLQKMGDGGLAFCHRPY